MSNQQSILRLRQVQLRIGLSRSTIYSMIKNGKFKAPIKLGPRAIGWLESDVEEFIIQRINASR